MNKIDFINSRSIKDVYSRLGLPLAQNVTAMTCPYCKHKNKKFGLSLFKNVYNCFHCGASGNNFQLVKTYLKISNSDTYKWFENYFNSSDVQSIVYKPTATQEAPEQAQNGKDFNQLYNRLLAALPIVKKSNYLVVERGLDINVLRENNIREAKSEGFFDITKFIPKDDALKAGLAYVNKAGKVVYLFWNCAYIMPLYDGDMIESIQGRSIGNNGKYWFLRNIKSPTFYIPKQPASDFYYICEGIITALAFLSDGKPAMCITSKKYDIDEVLRKLEPYKNKHFIFSPDIDGYKTNSKNEVSGVDTMRTLSKKLMEKCYNVESVQHSCRTQARSEGLDASCVKDYADILRLRKLKNERI